MSTISASTTSTTAYKVTADTTGTLVFQTGASPTTAMSISSSQIISFTNPPTATGGGSVSTNTAYGTSALAANTTGAYNTSVGYLALTTISTASYNVAVGGRALQNSNGDWNTGVGTQALYTNSSGANNTAFGASALFSNTTASYNTAVGYQAGYSNTVGANNTYIGWASGSAATGSKNTFVGETSGYFVTTGANNTILGRYNGNQGGIDIRTSSNNIVLSDGDGFPFFGNWSSSLGPFLNATGTYTQLSFTNTMVQKASIWWDNSLLRLQTYTGTTNGPYISNNGTSWTNSSDERLKNITGEIQNGLAKVCTLRAAEYTWKSDQEAKPQVGLIAQDVLAVLPEAVNVPEEGATEKDGSPAMMGVQYNEVIPLLVAAIKELKAEIDTLKGQA